ncbi:phosphatidylglycerophosphatase [Actibacterium mucosum KCTC 23349]|uniref:Phosphatidylglycerophosphatase A n=1 Tax=Actibacterium mucosum KCTC 23349 TaxID=1454373 RepID=A0A037ZMI4_9RHOB|nr:phosphatidylglycerophosphatase A [Actibacterium mucosum]KAJ56762.1 phosphatidylglycerophosphatase [Actibacterium mucosum KCTC 23349]
MTKLIATFFYTGLLRPASGTWGSLAACPALLLLHLAGGFELVVVATFTVFLLGWWATIRETEGRDDHDPSEIVIDEVAGMWISLWPVSLGAQMAGADVTALWPGWVVAFFAFRLFDIWKPGPVGWADRRNDPLGVMLDDVIAGIMAAIVVAAAAGIAHA